MPRPDVRARPHRRFSPTPGICSRSAGGRFCKFCKSETCGAELSCGALWLTDPIELGDHVGICISLLSAAVPVHLTD